MRPAYEIYADGERVTHAFQGHLLELSITDEAGSQADSLSVTIEDSAAQLALPRRGVVFRVLLGYEGALADMGLYAIDDIRVGGPPDTISIQGCGAAWVKTQEYQALQAKKSRSWEPGTLGKMVETMAREAGMEAAISPNAAAIQLPHIDQTDESDPSLLLRLARDRDITVKPTSGKLVVLMKGEGTTAKGASLPSVAIARAECSTWEFHLQGKVSYSQVVASYRDVKEAATHDVTVGGGASRYRIPTPYPSRDLAEAAADAWLRNFKRLGSEFTLTMAGRTDLIAEGRLALTGFRDELDEGTWRIQRVEHRLSRSGFSTTVSGIAVTENMPPPQ